MNTTKIAQRFECLKHTNRTAFTAGITLQATTEAVCFGCLFCGSAVVRKRPCTPQNKHRLAGRSLSLGII
ncbi:MAG: hypothetical protein IJE43_10360, partial [Alphaproteobacteria bacterium]|nr:hypothetical protein [Alphaproteobacteria bacterium]